jgi:hypothetical protein
VPGAEQEPEEGEVDRGCDQRRDPERHAQAESKVEDAAEAEEEGEADDDAHHHGDGLDDGWPVRT